MNGSGRTRTAAAVLLTLTCVLASCSTSSPSSSKADGTAARADAKSSTTTRKGDDRTGTPGKGTVASEADPLPDDSVHFADDVVVIRRTKGKTVKGTGNDGASILLDGDTPELKDLQVGSVMVLTGVGAGRVEAIDDVNGDKAVTYSSVSLPEVIADGELNWDDTAVDFSDGKVIVSPEMAEQSGAAVEPAAFGVDPAAARPTLLTRGTPAVMPASYRLSAGNEVSVEAGDFKVSFDWSPSDDGGGNLKTVLTPHSAFNGSITIDVDLKPITFGGGTKVAAGKVDFFDLDFANLQGTAKITAELQSLGPNSVLKLPPFFKLPVSVSIPVPVAGIPFTLTFGATLQIDMSFAVAAALKGEANFSFGGPAKFSYDGSSVSVSGNRTATSEDTLKQLLGGGGGPVGLNFTAEMPKVSFGLKIFQTGAGVFVSNGMVNSLTILPAPVLCHRVQVASVVAGGIDAQFLGASVTFTRKAFLDKRWTYYMPKGDKRCDGE